MDSRTVNTYEYAICDTSPCGVLGITIKAHLKICCTKGILMHKIFFRDGFGIFHTQINIRIRQVLSFLANAWCLHIVENQNTEYI